MSDSVKGSADVTAEGSNKKTILHADFAGKNAPAGAMECLKQALEKAATDCGFTVTVTITTIP